MKPIEILQALKDGNKVCDKDWGVGEFIYLKNNSIVDEDGDPFDIYCHIDNELTTADGFEPDLNFITYEDYYEDNKDKAILLIKSIKSIADAVINENKAFFHYQMMENILHKISEECEKFLKEKQ